MWPLAYGIPNTPDGSFQLLLKRRLEMRLKKSIFKAHVKCNSSRLMHNSIIISGSYFKKRVVCMMSSSHPDILNQ